MMKARRIRSHRGFSLIELLVVVAIMMAVAAVALPSFLSFISTYKLRSTLQQTSGMLQQMRMQAVRLNKNIKVQTTTMGTQTVGYADVNGNGAWDKNTVPPEPAVLFPTDITVTSTGHPGNATTSLGFTPQTGSGVMPQFNARGLPCVMAGSVCQNFDASGQVGFVVYVRNQSSGGGVSWGAITITPAGRVRSWLWNGTAYTGL